MKKLRYFSIVLAMLTLMAVPSTNLVQDPEVYAAGTVCKTSGPASGAYTLTLCFTSPVDGAALSGYPEVSATGSVSVTSPRIQRMVFYLDGQYLLTDYQAPYIFTLPTPKWVDGSHTLAVSALMSDAFTSQQATLEVSFNNGISTPPVNTNQYSPTSGRPPVGDEPFIVAAGGDGASGELNSVNVTNLIAAHNPNLFLWLGDVMEKGSPAEFYNWYGTPAINFGQFKAITNPTPGNHDYENGAAPGYFDYWDNIPNYYSYDANGWHFISLNSVSAYIGVKTGSPEYNWLAQDLAAHPAACTIVYYHHPYFNIGPQGATTILVDIWNLMVQNGVDIVLNGHDHNYQRWVPLDGAGNPSPAGITEFVAGATGHGTTTFISTDPRVAYANDTNPGAFGVLFLQLNPAGANFLYRNTAGSILDSGVVPCVGAGPDNEVPSAPANLSATASDPTSVKLTWSASRDNTGVSAYNIYRNSIRLSVQAPATATSYTDLSAMPGSTYEYSVQAVDQAGNSSALSAPASVSTPGMPAALTFTVQADTYVNASSPTSKYGSTTSLKVDADPDYHSYLRFNVQGLAGSRITKATLRLYAFTNNNLGVRVHAVADNAWGETTTSYSNAPALGSLLAASAAVTANSWVTLDVTPYITGEGLYSLGLTSTNTTSSTFAAREAGANLPELGLELAPSSPDTEPPSIPAGLAGTTLTRGTSVDVELAWAPASDNIAVMGYTVYRNGGLLATMTTNSYTDTSAAQDSTYQYAVDAYDASGNRSGASTPLTVSVPDINPPSVPAGLSAVINVADRADLSWSASSDNVGVAGYSVYRDGALLATLPPGTTYSDNTIQAGVSYQYAVDAFDAAGNHSARSAQAAALPPDTQAPSVPAALTAALVQHQAPLVDVDLSWNPSSDNTAVTGYSLYRDGSLLASVTTGTAYTDAGLPQDVTHQYSLEAYDAAGNHSAKSTPLAVTASDTQAPSLPTGLIAAATDPTHVDLTWTASSDNFGVTGYNIRRDGLFLATSSGASYIDAAVTPGTIYEYAVEAFDAAGNHSAFTAPVSLTTPSMPATLTFTPEADTYASAGSPASNYGKLTSLKLDASPVLQGYLRFTVQGLAGTPISRARLLFYAPTAIKAGIRLYQVADNTWNELTLTYNNAPVFGAQLTASPAITAGSWVTLDVSSYVTGEGTFSFGINTTTSTSSSLASRESGANAPQLLLDLDNTGPDTQAPTTPTALSAAAASPTRVDLTWSAAADNVGVTGYKLFRDGSLLATLSGTTHSDASVMPSSSYIYTLQAFDKAGNLSALSNPASITTPDLPASFTFLPEADTYVSATKPSTNYGTATSLRADASPDMHSYLRFNVQGLAGAPVIKASLRLFVSSTSSTGLILSRVADNAWGELNTNFNNAPDIGSLLGASGRTTSGTWITLDVTPYVTAAGQYSFALTTLSTSTLSLASRNSGANSAQLIVELR